MYRLLRNILFLFDAETVHYFTMNSLKCFCNIPFISHMIARNFRAPERRVSLLGLNFRNPIGLAAGFDKNARYLKSLKALGFGFIEIGTVTPLAQAGNQKPRLFRLIKDRAIINRMGFNNDGMDVIAGRLREFQSQKGDLIIGGNIGKNKITPNEDAWKDYEKCFIKLYDLVDYFVVNVSSPNTPGLRDLQQKDSLKKILVHLQSLREQKNRHKPILLKIAPDLSQEGVRDITDLAQEINLDGLVVSNTTISRENCTTDKNKITQIGNGGLSGKPLFEKSNQMLQLISELTGKRIPIIGSGGIFTKEDADIKAANGATLLQVFTGFIYQGPGIVKQILK